MRVRTAICMGVFVLMAAMPLPAINAAPVVRTAQVSYMKPIGYSDSTDTVLTTDMLYSIFTLKITSWRDGTPITVYILPKESNSMREFLWAYFGVVPSAYYDVLASASASGKSDFARVVQSEEALVEKVSATYGSIGIAKDSVIINWRSHVKVIRVIN